MNEPVIDSAVFNEIAELMDDALGAFIATYLENSRKLLASISNGLAVNDLESIFHNAHQLKGGSGSIGAMQVFQIAKQLEEEAKQGKADGLAGLFADLQSAYDQVAIELKIHL